MRGNYSGTHVLGGFPGGAIVKKDKNKQTENLPVNVGGVNDAISNPGLGRSPGEGRGNPFRYSCQENPRDRGACWTTAHEVTRVRHNLATKPPTTI